MSAGLITMAGTHVMPLEQSEEMLPNGGNHGGGTVSTPHSSATPGSHNRPVANGQQNTESYGIKEVFGYNLEEEMRKMNKLVKKFPFIAIDTEFPGVVARPCGVFNTNTEYEYALFKVNVDLMKLIQLGLSLFDENGQQPQPIHTWQFNFRFNLGEEMYAQDSIKLLIHAGIHFKMHESMGIEPDHFAERLITSDIVCNDEVRFLTFHSAYDFGYLLKVLEGTDTLPKTETSFMEKLKMYFPHVYDIKFMIRDQRTLKGGLQDLAHQFQLARVGAQHQAGSDSALTGALFFRLREDVFHGKLDEFSGRLFGLTGSFGDRVHHLENVVIKENLKGSSNSTASPVTGLLSSLNFMEDHEEKKPSASLSNPAISQSTTSQIMITSSTSSTNLGGHNNHASAASSHAPANHNTFAFLTNVNIPPRFYDESTGYVPLASSTASGELMVSNDPSVISQQQHHSAHAHHIYSTGTTSYYESNGYA